MDANGWFEPTVNGGTAIDQMHAGVTMQDSSHTAQRKISQANHEKMMASMGFASAGSYSALTTSLPNPFVFLKKKITWLLVSIAALMGFQLKLYLPPQPLEITGLAIFLPLIYYPQSKTALKIESVLIVFFGEYIPKK